MAFALLRPFVENVWDMNPEIRKVMTANQYRAIQNHNRDARTVCAALSKNQEFDKLLDCERETVYGALGRILNECPRLTLYLPFSVLRRPTEEFREIYRETWLSCSMYRDVREAFNVGDIYEASASHGEPERVVKAMHLIPWLLEYDYVTERNLIQLAQAFRDDDSITIWSIHDGVEAAHEMHLISEETYQTIREIAKEAKAPRPTKPQLLEITEERKKWLEDRKNGYNVDPREFKLRNITGPFSNNIDMDAVGNVELSSDHEYYIVNGSRLKGYGRPDSDYDNRHYDSISGTLVEEPELSERPELIVHWILFGAWIGQDSEATHRAQFDAASRYYKLSEKDRINSQFCLEKTMLQYRLMHKAMLCAYPDISMETRNITSIDGGSAFYDDRYRTIASQIYLKYIFLPPQR